MSDSFFDDAASEDTASPKASRKGGRKALIVLLGLLLVLGLGTLGVAGWYLQSLNDGLSSIKRAPGLLPDSAPPANSSEGAGEDGSPAPLNFLIIGSDSRGSDRGRSDTLMLMHIPSNRNSVNLISIPRDSWVPIEGHGVSKINAAYSWGGAPLAVTTVQNLLGIRINHVVITDFEGFNNTIEVLGGVDVYNARESSAHGYEWPAGHITLSTGEEAQRYVRQRHGLPNGDFDRSERQRSVATGIIKKLTSAGVITNPGKFRNALTTLGPNFTVDEGLTNEVIMETGKEVGLKGADNIRSLLLPTDGFGRSEGGASYVKLDDAGVQKLSTALQQDEFDNYWKQR